MFNTYGGAMDYVKKKKLMILGIISLVLIVVSVLIWFFLLRPKCSGNYIYRGSDKKCVLWGNAPNQHLTSSDMKKYPAKLSKTSDCKQYCFDTNGCTGYTKKGDSCYTYYAPYNSSYIFNGTTDENKKYDSGIFITNPL